MSNSEQSGWSSAKRVRGTTEWWGETKFFKDFSWSIDGTILGIQIDKKITFCLVTRIILQRRIAPRYPTSVISDGRNRQSITSVYKKYDTLGHTCNVSDIFLKCSLFRVIHPQRPSRVVLKYYDAQTYSTRICLHPNAPVPAQHHWTVQLWTLRTFTLSFPASWAAKAPGTG